MIVITTIDALPDYCYKCPCHDGESGYCQADKKQRWSEYRPYWCPLKEIRDDQEGRWSGMTDRDKTYLLKELTRTIDESDSTAAFCLCQRWILKDALALLKEQESVIEALKSDLDETFKVLGEQPEIIRCRECKYGCLMASGKVYMCESPEQNKKICVHVHKPDWFCANGERKD